MKDYICISVEELKATAFDYIASHNNSAGMTVDAEETLFDFIKLLLESKGVENGK